VAEGDQAGHDQQRIGRAPRGENGDSRDADLQDQWNSIGPEHGLEEEHDQAEESRPTDTSSDANPFGRSDDG
jgi:hypothetical protein